MREFLFRGKRIDSGEWVEGGYWVNDTITRQTTHIIDHDGNAHAIGQSTSGQYTGLTDKNGVKIFEGDVVRTNKYGKDDGAGHNSAGNDIFCVEFRDGGYHLFNGWRRFNLRPNTVVEIIGNVHDNPKMREEAPHA